MRIFKLLPLYLVIFLSLLGYSMMITVFTPLMFYKGYGTIGERIFWLGVLLSLYPIGQIVGSPLVLYVASKVGRKATYLISLCMTAVGYACMAMSIDWGNLIALGFSVFLAGFSESNVAMADQVIITKAVNLHHSQWVSYIETSKSSAFLFGPPFAGLLSLVSPSLPFWIIFFLLLISILWVAYLLPAPRHNKMRSSFWETVRKEPFYPFFLNFLCYFAIFV